MFGDPFEGFNTQDDGPPGNRRGSFGEGGFLAALENPSQDEGLIRQSQIQWIMPLKVSMILSARSARINDYALSILDRDLELFKLVGFVQDLVPSDNHKLAFNLDDGSGVVPVEWYIAWICDAELTSCRKQKFESVQNNTWVAVYGEINLFGKDRPHVKAIHIREVENYNEVFYHEIDAACNIAKALAGTESLVPGGNVSQAFRKTDENFAGEKVSRLDPATRSVYEILRAHAPHRDGGVSIHELLGRMKSSDFPDYTENNLRAALALLGKEGLSQRGKDYDHWNILL